MLAICSSRATISVTTKGVGRRREEINTISMSIFSFHEVDFHGCAFFKPCQCKAFLSQVVNGYLLHSRKIQGRGPSPTIHSAFFLESVLSEICETWSLEVSIVRVKFVTPDAHRTIYSIYSTCSTRLSLTSSLIQIKGQWLFILAPHSHRKYRVFAFI